MDIAWLITNWLITNWLITNWPGQDRTGAEQVQVADDVRMLGDFLIIQGDPEPRPLQRTDITVANFDGRHGHAVFPLGVERGEHFLHKKSGGH